LPNHQCLPAYVTIRKLTYRVTGGTRKQRKTVGSCGQVGVLSVLSKLGTLFVGFGAQSVQWMAGAKMASNTAPR
jgi:hypothetical protein